jgi:hypothetical protein
VWRDPDGLADHGRGGGPLRDSRRLRDHVIEPPRSRTFEDVSGGLPREA